MKTSNSGWSYVATILQLSEMKLHVGRSKEKENTQYGV